MPGDSKYLSQQFRQTASLGLLEAKGTSRLDVEVQAISSTLRSVYAWEADAATARTWDLEPSYTLVEASRWKSLYSTQIQGSSGPVLTHAFPATSPSH